MGEELQSLRGETVLAGKETVREWEQGDKMLNFRFRNALQFTAHCPQWGMKGDASLLRADIRAGSLASESFVMDYFLRLIEDLRGLASLHRDLYIEYRPAYITTSKGDS